MCAAERWKYAAAKKCGMILHEFPLIYTENAEKIVQGLQKLKNEKGLREPKNVYNY